jgi:hypothetical protein
MLGSALQTENVRSGLEEVKHSKQKELRIIETLEPVMNSHRLVVDEEVVRLDYRSSQERKVENPLKYSLFWQMTRITKERGCLPIDDRLDALAIGVAYWAEQESLGLDPRTSQRQANDADWKAEIADHVRYQVGRPIGGPSMSRKPNTIFGRR